MATKPIDQDVGHRIALLRYPMIFLIVVSHVPRISSFSEEPGLYTYITTFLVDGLIPLGIPMLTCISGFLVFSKGLEKNYQLLLRKRFVSLVIPLLAWNIPLALGLYIVQSTGITAYEFAQAKTMYPVDPVNWINGILALTDFPLNYPLHFLRDLFVICLLVPLLGWLVRNAPVPGLIALLVIFVPDLDGVLMRNNMMIVTFYIGATAASQNWNLRSLDRYAIALVLSLIVIGTFIVLMDAGRPTWLRLMAPFLLWPASSLIAGSRIGTWLDGMSRASIFLFLAHGIVFLVMNIIMPDLIAGTHEFSIWLALPFLVSFICHAIYLVLNTLVPDLLAIVMGGRRPSTKQLSPRNSVTNTSH